MYHRVVKVVQCSVFCRNGNGASLDPKEQSSSGAVANRRTQFGADDSTSLPYTICYHRLKLSALTQTWMNVVPAVPEQTHLERMYVGAETA